MNDARASWVVAALLAVGCAGGDRDRDEIVPGAEADTDDLGPTAPTPEAPAPDDPPAGGDGDDTGGCAADGCGAPTPTAACSTDADCDTGVCAAGACVVATTCAELHERAPLLQSGRYVIDPDLDGGEAPTEVFCDMATDGGGWTIVYASDGRDGNVPVISHDVRAGNPLSFEHYNLHTLDKIRLNELSSELMVRRPGAVWLVADAAPFTADLLTPTSEAYFAVMLHASDGASANGWVGWSNYNISGGGDFGITSTDGQTCEGWITSLGFDHHNPSFWNLNCGCARHYLYSMSSDVPDADAAYHAGVGLGGWTPTAACVGTEGAGDPLYIAVR